MCDSHHVIRIEKYFVIVEVYNHDLLAPITTSQYIGIIPLALDTVK